MSTDVRAWPTLSRAARMLGVAPSTLSRRQDLGAEPAGVQQRRLAPGTVMRLARLYRKRVVEEVAFDLVAYAKRNAVDLVPAVEDEIDAALAATTPVSDAGAEEFLASARSFLPAELYQLVVQAVRTPGESRGVVADDGEDEQPGRDVRGAVRSGRGSRTRAAHDADGRALARA